MRCGSHTTVRRGISPEETSHRQAQGGPLLLTEDPTAGAARSDAHIREHRRPSPEVAEAGGAVPPLQHTWVPLSVRANGPKSHRRAATLSAPGAAADSVLPARRRKCLPTHASRSERYKVPATTGTCGGRSHGWRFVCSLSRFTLHSKTRLLGAGGQEEREQVGKAEPGVAEATSARARVSPRAAASGRRRDGGPCRGSPQPSPLF